MSELSGINSVAFVSGAATDPKIRAGTGSPEGVVSGSVGDVWQRQDGAPGTTYYVKESGTDTTTGWTAFGQAGTKSAFIIAPSQSPSTVGDHIGSSVGVNGSGNIEFGVPADFNSLVSADVIVIPGGTLSADIDLTSDYGAVGELFNANSEADPSLTFPFTTDTMAAIDISTVITGIAAGDNVGVALDANSVSGGFLILGLRFRYQ